MVLAGGEAANPELVIFTFSATGSGVCIPEGLSCPPLLAGAGFRPVLGRASTK